MISIQTLNSSCWPRKPVRQKISEVRRVSTTCTCPCYGSVVEVYRQALRLFIEIENFIQVFVKWHLFLSVISACFVWSIHSFEVFELHLLLLLRDYQILAYLLWAVHICFSVSMIFAYMLLMKAKDTYIHFLKRLLILVFLYI